MVIYVIEKRAMLIGIVLLLFLFSSLFRSGIEKPREEECEESHDDEEDAGGSCCAECDNSEEYRNDPEDCHDHTAHFHEFSIRGLFLF